MPSGRIIPSLVFLAASIAVSSLCTGASGQVVQTSPEAAADDPSALHIHTTTRRVAVDVVVTGEKGKPVAGLSPSDFTIFEDGVLQPLRSFDPHTPTTEVPYVPPHIPKLPPNTFLNLASAPASGPPTVLLYDVINTPPDSLMYAHEEMVRFIKHRKPGTQIAIFVLGDKLRLLQGFTDNTDELTAAIDSKSGHVGQSTQLSQAGSTETSAESLAPSTAASLAPADAHAGASQSYENNSVTQAVSTLQSAEALEQSYLLDQRIEITLAGLTEIGRFLAGLPGRKNLVWLSASFPAGILPDSRITVDTLGQDQSTRNYGEEVKEATDLLNLSHVAVYPVDVRGVIVSAAGGYSASSSSGSYGQTGHAAAAALATVPRDRTSEYSTMDSIAESTGGRAFYSTNDVQGAVDEAMQNGSTYYSMTYSPSNSKLDGTVRKIRVTLKEPGYKLSYRTTYYADDLQRAAQEVADAPQSPLSPSLERGAPVSHELFVEARLQALGAPLAATPKQLEMLAAYESKTAKKKGKKVAPPTNLMMQNYLITYGLVPRQLDLQPEPDGRHKATLELGVLSYDEDGHKLNGLDTKIEDNIPAQRYALIPEEGYHLYQTVTIPVTASLVRLAVRDTAANHVGSLEVPLPLAKTP